MEGAAEEVQWRRLWGRKSCGIFLKKQKEFGQFVFDFAVLFADLVLQKDVALHLHNLKIMVILWSFQHFFGDVSPYLLTSRDSGKLPGTLLQSKIKGFIGWEQTWQWKIFFSVKYQ